MDILASPFRCNWGERPRVEYAWRTGIHRSRSGYEDRWAERQTPRMTVEFEHLTLRNEAEAGRVRRYLDANIGKPIYLQDFRASAWIFSAAGRTLTLDRAARFGAGMRVQINAAGREAVAMLAAVDGATVTLDRDLPSGLDPVRCEIVTVTAVTLNDEIETTELPGGYLRVNLRARSLPGLDPELHQSYAFHLASGQGLPEYPLLPLPHNWVDDMSITYSRAVDAIDYEIGRRQDLVRERAGARIATLKIQTMDREQAGTLLDFLDYAQGQLSPFGCLSSVQDFPSLAAISPPGSLTPYWQFRFPTGLDRGQFQTGTGRPKRIVVRNKDGSYGVFARRLAVDITTVANRDVVAFDLISAHLADGTLVAEMDFTINGIADVKNVSAWRLASDSVVLDYSTDIHISCEIRLRELVEYRA